MPRIRLGVATVLFLAFSTQLSDDNITMVCDAGDDEKRYFKYVDPWLGRSSVEQKVNGVWKDWCRPTKNSVCEVKIHESAASLQTTQTGKTSKFVSVADGLKKGDKVIYYSVIDIDFEFVTRTVFNFYVNLVGKEVLNDYAVDTTYTCEIW